VGITNQYSDNPFSETAAFAVIRASRIKRITTERSAPLGQFARTTSFSRLPPYWVRQLTD
jgi:hypothetical protein